MSENQKGCSPSDCQGCAHAGTCNSKPQDFHKPANAKSHIRNVIAVVSGKGGVGKSMVTASLARMMREQGFSVGILDADITGPSIPKAFGIHGMVGVTADQLMLPRTTSTGIEILSSNLILEHETDPVIWRGPVVGGVIKQFWSEALWKDIDYMFVDMPPGTGDVPLTVFQSLPLAGIIIVTSPQELVSMIVAKAVNMAKKMDIPILGLVENMSYLECPDCGKKISDEIQAQIFDALKWLEEYNGKKLGDVEDPLLVSVRSGARASMPGMMDTILNLSLIHISEPTRLR